MSNDINFHFLFLSNICHWKFMCYYRENDKTCINSFNGFSNFRSKLIMKAFFFLYIFISKGFFEHSLSSLCDVLD